MDAASTPTPARPVRILRVIARLNMGGPSHHVGLLGSRLDPERYETLLLHGELGAGEDSLEESVRARGIAMAQVPGLRPELRPQDDARALGSITRAIRRLRPDIVHTHTAKAGMLGRTRRRDGRRAAARDRPHLPRARARGLLRPGAQRRCTATSSTGWRA